MLKPALCFVLIASALAPVRAQEEAAPEAALEKVVVTGQRPGPGLWKVSKDGHVMWVFGTYAPLPAKMQWRSQQVEAILAQSQEMLSPPHASASVGFFKGVTLLPQLIGIKKNPDGATLQQVLPADVYGRWKVLKQKYIGEDEGIERERPIFVADTLFSAGLRQAGLSNHDEVGKSIVAMAKRSKVKITYPNIELEGDPGKMIKSFKQTALDDAECFAKTLDRLESDIDGMRQRANAWAIGDLSEIQKLNYADREEACNAALSNSRFVQDQPALQSIKERVQLAWLAAAEKSMTTNAVTFAMLPIKDLLDPKGYMASLQSQGYTVEKPE